LSGVIVRFDLRRRGIARQLTALRIEDLRTATDELFYFVNARNRASIDLHASFGFEELTRDFDFPGATFEGGEGILFGLQLHHGDVSRISTGSAGR
jgi:ribosomal protein S18 acetylase RimI-like enzyme